MRCAASSQQRRDPLNSLWHVTPSLADTSLSPFTLDVRSCSCHFQQSPVLLNEAFDLAPSSTRKLTGLKDKPAVVEQKGGARYAKPRWNGQFTAKRGATFCWCSTHEAGMRPKCKTEISRSSGQGRGSAAHSRLLASRAPNAGTSFASTVIDLSTHCDECT